MKRIPLEQQMIGNNVRILDSISLDIIDWANFGEFFLACQITFRQDSPRFAKIRQNSPKFAPSPLHSFRQNSPEFAKIRPVGIGLQSLLLLMIFVLAIEKAKQKQNIEGTKFLQDCRKDSLAKFATCYNLHNELVSLTSRFKDFLLASVLNDDTSASAFVIPLDQFEKAYLKADSSQF